MTAVDQEKIDLQVSLKDGEEKESFFGIVLKSGYSLSNLLAIPMCYITGTIAATFTNVNTIFLLRNEEYFNVPQDQIGRVSNDLIFYSIPATIIGTLFCGYAFDIFGRKITLCLGAILSSIFLFLVPLAPSVYPWLYIVRMALSASIETALCTPLVVDYVKKRSRGKATALLATGWVVGDLFTFAILFQITKYMDPIPAFAMASGTVLLLAMLFLFIVKEPDMRHLHESKKIEENFDKISTARKIIILTKHVIQAARNDIVIPIGFVGIMIIRLILILFNTFVMLWVTSFVDKGILSSESEAKDIIQNVNIIVVIFSVCFFKFAGNFTDKYPAYFTIPFSFLLRAIAVVFFVNITDPRELSTYVAMTLLVLGTLFENTTLDGLFSKHLPKDIRGSLKGAYNFFGSLGLLMYSKVGGILYDTVSPNAPFILLAICDVGFALLVIGLTLCKKFKD